MALEKQINELERQLLMLLVTLADKMRDKEGRVLPQFDRLIGDSIRRGKK